MRTRKDLENMRSYVNDCAMSANMLKRKVQYPRHRESTYGDQSEVYNRSNFHSRLLSPLLTFNGMDKRTQKARPLEEITGSHTFDCGLLHDRNFMIDRNKLDIAGFGRDRNVELYLNETLNKINEFNKKKTALVPLYVNGDGHCLVHAISRAAVGHELFWHPLRSHLKRHIEENVSKYKQLLCNFMNDKEWKEVIEESDPNYVPPNEEAAGLRNVHIFGLCNILKRPIILFDSSGGMQSFGDYSAVFLPVLSSPSECVGKNGALNPPLCIAWASGARNHFVPLVGIEGDKLCAIPSSFLPNAWAVPQEMLKQYMKYDNDYVTIVGDKMLNGLYIKKLKHAMDDLYLTIYKVHPQCVCDIFLQRGKLLDPPISGELYASETLSVAEENLVYRCLTCKKVAVLQFNFEWLRPGGLFYELAQEKYSELRDGHMYYFSTSSASSLQLKHWIVTEELLPNGVSCTYDISKNVLVLIKNLLIHKCCFCSEMKMRIVLTNGQIVYENGDPTAVQSISEECGCGYKHWWDGKEYDTPPVVINVTMAWKGQLAVAHVPWFQYDSDRNLNSNVYTVGAAVVSKCFPGQFGSEIIAERLVSELLEVSLYLEHAKRIPCSKFVSEPSVKILVSDTYSSSHFFSPHEDTPVPLLHTDISSSSEISVAQENKNEIKEVVAMSTVESRLNKEKKKASSLLHDIEILKYKLKGAESDFKCQCEKYIERNKHFQDKRIQQSPLLHDYSVCQYSGVADYNGKWNSGRHGTRLKGHSVPETFADSSRRLHKAFEDAYKSSKTNFGLEHKTREPYGKTVRVGPGYSVLALPETAKSTIASDVLEWQPDVVTSNTPGFQDLLPNALTSDTSSSTRSYGVKRKETSSIQGNEITSIMENYKHFGTVTPTTNAKSEMDSEDTTQMSSSSLGTQHMESSPQEYVDTSYPEIVSIEVCDNVAQSGDTVTVDVKK